MRYLFWQLNFLLLSGATNSGLMYHEAAALANNIDPRWNHTSSELSTLYAKAKAYEAGERVEFAGQKFTPLYTPRNDKLIELFQITDAEQTMLRTIISSAEARERDRQRDEGRRRGRGEIAKDIGVSLRAVGYYISAGRDKCAKSLRITCGEAVNFPIRFLGEAENDRFVSGSKF